MKYRKKPDKINFENLKTNIKTKSKLHLINISITKGFRFVINEINGIIVRIPYTHIKTLLQAFANTCFIAYYTCCSITLNAKLII